MSEREQARLLRDALVGGKVTLATGSAVIGTVTAHLAVGTLGTVTAHLAAGVAAIGSVTLADKPNFFRQTRDTAAADNGASLDLTLRPCQDFAVYAVTSVGAAEVALQTSFDNSNFGTVGIYTAYTAATAMYITGKPARFVRTVTSNLSNSPTITINILALPS